MDVAYLESLIAGALALMLRAQQQAGPMLDLCSPRLIGPKEREELRQAHGQIALAFVHANSAAQQLAQAAGMLGGYLRPKAEDRPQMQRVTLTVSGTYHAAVMRPETIEGLRVSIEQHLKAYGLKGIEIFANVATEAERP